MAGFFEPTPHAPKPKKPQYVLPKTASRGRLSMIVAGTAALWTLVFSAVGAFISYVFWPWLSPTFPPLLSHAMFFLAVTMGIFWGLMVGLRLMREVVKAGVEAGEVELV